MKIWKVLTLAAIVYSPAGYTAEGSSLQTSDKELIICHERSGLLKIVRSMKANDKEGTKKVFDNKECAIAPKGTPFKVLNVEEAYTLIEIHDRGAKVKLWTFHLK